MKLAHNEQCISLYPLTTDYSVGRFQPMLTFGLLRAHFILGLISRIRLVTVRYWPVPFVGQIQPVVTLGPLTRWAVFIALSNTAY